MLKFGINKDKVSSTALIPLPHDQPKKKRKNLVAKCKVLRTQKLDRIMTIFSGTVAYEAKNIMEKRKHK